MLKKIRIKIDTKQREVKGSLFGIAGDDTGPIDHKPQALSVTTAGSYYDNGVSVQISYREGELSGMEGTRTVLSFSKAEPRQLTLTRDGAVSTRLFFEEGQCHTALYKTPYMPFEVAVLTQAIQNRIEENGTLFLDYTVELKGANATKTEFQMTVLPDFDAPISK